MSNSTRVCPVESARSLDLGIRRLVHNPARILKPFIQPGMSVLDFGCGPGFFTIDAARLVGPSGKVFAADLQQGMLDIVIKKISSMGLDKVVTPHRCEANRIGLTEKVDLVLVFYALHEVPDREAILLEMKSLLKPSGSILVVEPKFHVSEASFANLTRLTTRLGFEVKESASIFFSRAVILTIPGNASQHRDHSNQSST